MTGPLRVLDTRDIDEARATVAACYCEHRLDVTGSGRTFHAVQTESVMGRVRIHRLRYGADLAIKAAPLRSTVLVTSPRRGHLVVNTARGERRLAPRDVLAIDPDTPFVLHWLDDCELHTVQVDRSLLTAGATDSGRPDSVAGARVLEGRRAHAWHRLLSLLEAPHDLDTAPLLQHHLEATVAAMVLANHGVRSDERRRAPTVTSRDVRRAVDFVEAHAGEPLRAADIAEAAHLSVRGLQVALRRHLDVTPSQLLRTVRLTRAHEDLVNGGPDVTTVAAIAHRWGFSNLGRFARDYRARYDATPSQTLRGRYGAAT